MDDIIIKSILLLANALITINPKIAAPLYLLAAAVRRGKIDGYLVVCEEYANELLSEGVSVGTSAELNEIFKTALGKGDQ